MRINWAITKQGAARVTARSLYELPSDASAVVLDSPGFCTSLRERLFDRGLDAQFRLRVDRAAGRHQTFELGPLR